MSNLRTIVDTHASKLATKKNVVGVAVGQKWSNGVNTGKDAILIFVQQKEDLSKLKESDKIPQFIDGVCTDVVGKAGQLTKLAYITKERPISPGISAGHALVTAGTIGGIFKDREGDIVALSNNHVFAAENKAKRGDAILQPGVYDGGKIGDKIGTLKYYRELVRKGMIFNAFHWKEIWNYNVEDSAIAVLSNADQAMPEIKELGLISGWNDTPTVGMSVVKTGRTTGKTTGKIIAVSATVFVSYDMGTLEFRDQIITTNMSSGGDSGSLLLDTTNKAVGLLSAGSNTITIHGPIKYPRASFGLELWNKVPLTETTNITVLENGVEVPQTLAIADLQTAINAARTTARSQNKKTEITVVYTVEKS